MEFKDKVLQVRLQLGLSQEAFSKELGVGVATIIRWENGQTNPNKLKEYAFNQFCKQNSIVIEENK